MVSACSAPLASQDSYTDSTKLTHQQGMTSTTANLRALTVMRRWECSWLTTPSSSLSALSIMPHIVPSRSSSSPGSSLPLCCSGSILRPVKEAIYRQRLLDLCQQVGLDADHTSDSPLSPQHELPSSAALGSSDWVADTARTSPARTSEHHGPCSGLMHQHDVDLTTHNRTGIRSNTNSGLTASGTTASTEPPVEQRVVRPESTESSALWHLCRDRRLWESDEGCSRPGAQRGTCAHR